jgi:hypothetical protein
VQPAERSTLAQCADGLRGAPRSGKSPSSEQFIDDPWRTRCVLGPGLCSQGLCAQCDAGSACDGTSPCAQGVVSCTTGSPVCEDTATPKMDGTSCGSGIVCQGGACVSCQEDAGCVVSGNPCREGRLSCAAGQVCNDTGVLRGAGEVCGVDAVCSPTGSCVSCTEGAGCAPDEPCRDGVISCATGTPVCGAAGVKAAGTACAGGVCLAGGACAPCQAGMGCTPSACTAGVVACGATGASGVNVTSVDAGTACPGGVCVGATCIACVADAGCVDNPNAPCRLGVEVCGPTGRSCTDGAPKPVATACATDAGVVGVCNSAGACVSCTAGQTCSTNPSSCLRGATARGTGAQTCEDTAAAVDAGVTCGSGQVRNGMGGYIACAAGAGCATNASECRLGVTQCGSGAPVCADGAPKTASTSCDGHGACSMFRGLTIAMRPNTTGLVAPVGAFHLASNGTRVAFSTHISKTSPLSEGIVGASASEDGITWSPITAIPGADVMNPSKSGTPMSLFGGRGGPLAASNFLAFYNGPVNGGTRRTYRLASIDGANWTVLSPAPDAAIGIAAYGIRTATNIPFSTLWYGIQFGTGRMGYSEAQTGGAVMNGWAAVDLTNPDAQSSDEVIWTGPRFVAVKGNKYSLGDGTPTGWVSYTFASGSFSQLATNVSVVVTTGTAGPVYIRYSLDHGMTWGAVTNIPSGWGAPNMSAPVWTGKVFFIVGRARVSGGFCYGCSANGVDWTFGLQPVANPSVVAWSSPPVALKGKAVTLQNAIPGTDYVGIWDF